VQVTLAATASSTKIPIHSDAIHSVDWEQFKLWLLQEHTSRNAGDLCRYARKYHTILWESSEASRMHGLPRYVEAVNAYNLTIQLSRQQRLEEYCDADRQLLEHYGFKDLFMRRSKKVFVSFIPEELIDDVRDSMPLTKNAIQNRINRASIPS